MFNLPDFRIFLYGIPTEIAYILLDFPLKTFNIVSKK